MTSPFNFEKVPDDEAVRCSNCGWSGLAGDLGLELFEEVLECDFLNGDGLTSNAINFQFAVRTMCHRSSQIA